MAEIPSNTSHELIRRLVQLAGDHPFGFMMTFLRLSANGVVLVGCVLLVRVLFLSFTGRHAEQLFPLDQPTWRVYVFALALSLPVPLHVISVGLILQRKWLSPVWSRIAWFAVVISGCWLGIALAVKHVYL